MKCLALPTPDQPKSAAEFIAEVSKLPRDAREAQFLEYLQAGHLPARLRTMVPVAMTFVDKAGAARSLELHVLPDYLQIGTDDDSFIVPLWPLTAQRLADACGCMLPTTRVVTLIWNAATWKVAPQPWGPPWDASMMSTARIVAHNKRIEVAMASMGVDRTQLVAGHKKDVVLTNQLAAKPKSVAIFGWHKTNGRPIQPLYLGHENTYGDYSHGIRFVHGECTLDGAATTVAAVLQDPKTCAALSDEGPLHVLRQPGV